MTKTPEIIDFLNELSRSLLDNTLIKLTLSRPALKKQDLKNIYVRPVKIKDEILYSITYRYAYRDEVKNFPGKECLNRIRLMIGTSFLNLHCFMLDKDIEVRFDKDTGLTKYKESNPSFSELPDLTHDKKKMRWIQTKGNVYLKELGITDKEEKVIHSSKDKFRQIQKYIEIFDGLISKLDPKQKLYITDMGSGKGYLTFALYDFLVNNKGLDVEMIGVEQREKLVKQGNTIAKKAGFKNLKFVSGNILDYKPSELNILIALHACDTATDEAIFKGIKAKADIILCAPCCHKQVRKSMKADLDKNPMIKFGILEERQAEIVTDTIRALLMNKYGYETNVFEFISTDHTPKNLMISGIKTKKSQGTAEIDKKLENLKSQFGIEYQHLEKLLDKK